MRAFCAFLAALLMTLVSGSPALAPKTLTARILLQPNSPIRILACSGNLGAGSPGFAFDRSVGRGLEDFSAYEQVTFENVNTQIIREVGLRFATFNVVGGPLDTIEVSVRGTFSPGIPIRDTTFQQFNSHGEWLDSMKCSLARIVFADGSVWTP